MKIKNVIAAFFILTLFSCNKGVDVQKAIDSGNIDEMQSARAALETQYSTIKSQIADLDKAIAEVDTAQGKYEIVSTHKVVDSAYHHFIELHANIEAQQDVNITPEYSGVLSLNVSEGQSVGKGALIATISDGGLRDQLSQAQIQVDLARSNLNQAQIQSDLAKTTYQKQTQLWNQKIGSEMQYLQAKTQYETSLKAVQAAQQQVAAAQKGVSAQSQQLKKTRLYAPFSGVVEQVITKSGQVVSPGTPIVRLVNPNNIRAVAEVPEQHLENIKVGTEAIVEIPSINQKIDSKVSLVSSSINPSNRSFEVEVPLSSEGGVVKPNLNAKMLLNDYTNPDAIVIPESVVKESSKGDYVFIATNIGGNGQGIAKKVYIETGARADGYIEVKSGLKNGDYLITESPKNLSDGDKVKISNQ